MKTTIAVCDRCGKEIPGTDSRIGEIRLHLGREMDAAGSMENVGETIDLCHRCCVVLIAHATNERTASTGYHIEANRFLKEIRNHRASVPPAGKNA